jgi:GTP cyclohydrolase I
MAAADPDAGSPLQDAVTRILRELDPEPLREGLRATPRRVERALRFYTSGYHQDPKAVIGGAMYAASSDEMVLVKDIEMYSLCEHHLAPFFGKAHVAYIPNGKIVGLSKLARLVDVFARRLQVRSG